jgi:hypothetical protein
VAGLPAEFSKFLKNFHWVDFGQDDPDPMGQLVYGITGVHPDAQ